MNFQPTLVLFTNNEDLLIVFTYIGRYRPQLWDINRQETNENQ